MKQQTNPLRDQQLAEDLARMLLEIKAVSIAGSENLFTWVSGIRSPIYCDNRITISYPIVRTAIAGGFARLIREGFPGADVIAGTATAGIPHAAWVAQELEKPMVYVRSTPKGHGKGNQIEGRLEQGSKVILIEDLLSTGGSSLKAVEALQDAGAEVVAVLAIFSYQFPEVQTRFEAAGIPFQTLTDYGVLLPLAASLGYVKEEEIEVLRAWSSNPRIFTDNQ